jgi:hypothetical protein
MGNLKKMLRNFTTTPSLPFKQQQNIDHSHVFHCLGKNAAKLPVNDIFKTIGGIWKELDKTKREQPTRMYSDHPFRSYSSLKMICLKSNVKTAAFFTCK